MRNTVSVERLTGAGLLCCGLFPPAAFADAPAPKTVRDLPLLYEDDFDAPALDRWAPTDSGAWAFTQDGDRRVYALAKKSTYRPKVRSPYGVSLLKDVIVGDFVLDAWLRSTTPDYGHRDMCVVFGHQDAEHFYYAHFGLKADAHSNTIMIVDGKPRTSIAKTRTDGTPWTEGYHHVRIARDTTSGSIEVYFDDMSKPVMTAEDRTFTWGRVGVGSFDDIGNVDRVVLWGRSIHSKTASQLLTSYKRIHQDAFRQILEGDADAAIEDLRRILEAAPHDAESHYMLTAAFARLGRLDEAVAHMRHALEAGLAPGRFAAGLHNGLEPLADHPAMQELLDEFKHRLVHGPMLGGLTPERVQVWVRTAGPAEVQLVVSPSPEFGKFMRSESVQTAESTDFTTTLSADGLKPDTTYHYRVRVNGSEDSPEDGAWTFHTPRPGDQRGKLRIAFGGGAGYVPPHERMWDTIATFKPGALLMLGDNVYIDDPTRPAMQRYCYHRRQSRPEWRRLVASTPVYAIYDDHDFGTNDCSGGPEIDEPAWKRTAWKIFRDNWVNPAYGGGEPRPGCWFDAHVGNVHLILIDGRYYRTPPGYAAGPPSMIGPVQKRWLIETLESSTGTFKLFCSPVAWTFEAKGDSPDTWNGFRDERGEIFGLIAEKRINGVVLVSADRHRSDLWKIEPGAGYTLHEFSSSRLTNQHVHPTMEAAEFSYNDKQSFGLIDIDTAVSDPTVTYRILTIDGEEVHAFTRKLSELSHASAR